MRLSHWLLKFGLVSCLCISEYVFWQSQSALSFKNRTEQLLIHFLHSSLCKLEMLSMTLIHRWEKSILSMPCFSCIAGYFSWSLSCKIFSCVSLKIAMFQSSMRKTLDGYALVEQRAIQSMMRMEAKKIIMMVMMVWQVLSVKAHNYLQWWAEISNNLEF